MAANRSAGTLCFVLLLCCWHEAELQPVNMTSDEILVQEILEPNKSTLVETPSMESALTTSVPKGKNAGTDENYQAGSSDNYHELLENLHLSSGNEDKVSNKEASAENLHITNSEKDQDSQLSSGLERTTSSKGGKNSGADQYKRLSVLDKILQNMRRSTGNFFR
ncbi:sperm acrosome-associated protein 7 isoform X2 [Microcebus murinus]|uniref:sperm acrosome-associated protein 7 isoform X2 n=1 Tax=Microcebus murinus TaxID=30608 RepID=UPI000643AD93|nr:sperm acrosome-associated protein 7 isoform X2 [Microcebus murinus]